MFSGCLAFTCESSSVPIGWGIVTEKEAYFKFSFGEIGIMHNEQARLVWDYFIYDLIVFTGTLQVYEPAAVHAIWFLMLWLTLRERF